MKIFNLQWYFQRLLLYHIPYDTAVRKGLNNAFFFNIFFSSTPLISMRWNKSLWNTFIWKALEISWCLYVLMFWCILTLGLYLFHTTLLYNLIFSIDFSIKICHFIFSTISFLKYTILTTNMLNVGISHVAVSQEIEE